MDKLKRTDTNSTPPALQAISRKPMVKFLQEGKLDRVAALMPLRIEEAVKGTPISVVARVVDPLRIEAFLAFLLTKEVADMWNGDQRLNLQSHQIPIIAKSIMQDYPNENLADFTLCFRRGVMGKYTDKQEKLLRIDGAVIFSWIDRYMDEKYQVIEDALYKEKDNQYFKNVVPENSDRDWLSEWQKAVIESDGVRAVRDITQEEIESEGREKPKKESYPATSYNEVKKRKLHIQWIKENYDARTGDPLPTWIKESEWTKRQLEK